MGKINKIIKEDFVSIIYEVIESVFSGMGIGIGLFKFLKNDLLVVGAAFSGSVGALTVSAAYLAYKSYWSY